MAKPRPPIRARWIPLLLAAALLPAAGQAQIPDEFKNLKVLPEDIDKRQLIDTMKSFTQALGVRCEHCHVGEGDDLSKFDFAADDKVAKRTARVMIQMVRAINGEYLAKVEEKPLVVGCITCHRGQTHPKTLQQALAETLEEGGIEAAVGRYRELRERYYGSHTFDFSERVLIDLALKLAAQERLEAAIALLELNLEHYPRSASSHHYLGEVHLEAGDRERARRSFEKSLELDPDNPRAKKRLEELSAAPPGDSG